LPTPGFHHLHLNAADPDAAILFYTTSFPNTSKSAVAGLPALKTGHVFLLFNKMSKAPSNEQSAFWHFGWTVTNASDYWTRYRTSGAPLMPLYTDEGDSVTFGNEWWPGTLTKSEIPGARARGVRAQSGGYGFLRGPDGVIIEFAGDQPAERFNHVHMYQEHVFCAEMWYEQHLRAPVSAFAIARRPKGGRPSEADCQVPRGEPSWLSLEPQGTIRRPAGGVTFGDVELNWYQRQGAQPLVTSMGQAVDHVGLSVQDLHLWLTTLRGEGVRILREPYRFGAGRAFMIEGPSREAIEILETTQ
jgi:catechol 2,3-dioxygenase-like lactoylglutathione lyase family enzyme